MSKKPFESEEPNYETELPLRLGKVRLTLLEVGDDRSMRLRRQGKTLGVFPLNRNLTSVDLPLWIASVLRYALPDISPQALEEHIQAIRRHFPTKWDPISICVGSKAEFHRCCIFHVEPGSFTPIQEGSMVSFQARDEGVQFGGEKPAPKWTFLFQSRSDSAAATLKSHFSQCWGNVFSLDHDATGEDVLSVVAYNAERWETAGLSQDEVFRLANARNVVLRGSASDGSRLGFRVVT